MTRGVGVPRGVPVRRVVAAARATAFLAGAQVDPGAAHRDALVADVRLGRPDACHRIDVFACRAGQVLLIPSRRGGQARPRSNPSPTADATRFMLRLRTSPTAKTPGRLVSRKCGDLASGHAAVDRSSADRSGPVLMKPFSSRATQLPASRCTASRRSSRRRDGGDGSRIPANADRARSRPRRDRGLRRARSPSACGA